MSLIDNTAYQILESIRDRKDILVVHEFDTARVHDLLDILFENGLMGLESKKYGKIAILKQKLTDQQPSKGGINFHTDGIYYAVPPLYVLMYCVTPGTVQNPTLFLPACQILSALTPMSNKVLSLLEISYPYSSLLNYHPIFELWEGKVILTLISRGNIRLNMYRCKEKKYEPTLREINYALTELYHVLDSADYQTHNWAKGDLILFNNRTMLHALGPNSAGNYVNHEREIHRVWLQSTPSLI